jgi:hypothetical protein
MTKTPSRAAVTLGVVDDYWRTTSDIADRLYAAGFTWGTATTRSVLRALHEVGQIESQRMGAGYRWRKLPEVDNPHPATVDDLGVIVDKIAGIAQQVAGMTVAPPPPPAKAVTVGEDVDLVDLTEAQRHIAQRIVKRAAYETGKALLDVLEGWYETASENHVALEHREDDDGCMTFRADDIRRMVNDAMRVMGAPEAYRP